MKKKGVMSFQDVSRRFSVWGFGVVSGGFEGVTRSNKGFRKI